MDGATSPHSKMFKLSHQLPFTTEIMHQLTRMTQFLVLFYTISCLNGSLGADAPYNDLKFILLMMDYRAVDNEIAEAASQKVLKKLLVFNTRIGHSFAMLVVFAMFSSNQNISVKTKEEMAKTLLQTSKPDVFRAGKPVFVHTDQSTQLFDLIGLESWFLFTALNISHDWLSLPCRE